MKVTTSTSSAALLALAHLAHSASALPASSAHLQRREATGTITPMCYTVALPSGVEYKLSVAWPTMVEPKAASRVRVTMPDQPNQPKVLYEIPESEPLAPQFDMYMLGIQYLDNKIAGSGISWGNFDDMMKNGAAATVVAGTEPLDITSLPGQIEFTVTSGGVSKVAVIDIAKDCHAR